MEKTIRVTDLQGNLLEATYPKRAKGLVKHGRARFTDDHTICLTCPPNRILEEKDMNEQTTALEPIMEATVYNHPASLSPAEILEKIAEIQHDNGHIYQALSALEKIPTIAPDAPGAPEDVAGQAKAKAYADTVRVRETTQQKLLGFYTTLYQKGRASGFSPDLGEILTRIGEIQNDAGHIYGAMSTLEKIPTAASHTPGAPEDVAGQAKARAAMEIIRCRETTNQMLLDFYFTLCQA